MTRENAQILVEQFNEKYAAIVEVAIFKALGVSTKLQASIYENRRNGDCYIDINETGEDTKKQLTATPLLRAMFNEAHIDVSIYQIENTIQFSVGIRYHHTNGGSNGLSDLMGIIYNIDTEEVKCVCKF